MKKFILVAIMIITLPSICISETAYENLEGKFSMAIPSGWIQVPKDVLENQFNEIDKLINGKSKRFDICFQKESERYFTYPYMYVEIDKSVKVAESDLKKYISDKVSGYDIKEFSDKYSEKYGALLIEKADIGKMVYDQERKRLIVLGETNVKNVGVVKVLSLTYLTSFGNIKLLFYSKRDEYNNYLPIFNKIINSFKLKEN